MLSAAAAAKLLQSCLTLWDPIEGNPRGSPVPGILQARTLEWTAISFSSACKWKVKVKTLSRIQLLAAPWTESYQAPPSMGFSRQEYWSGLPLPSPVAYVDHCLIFEPHLLASKMRCHTSTFLLNYSLVAFQNMYFFSCLIPYISPGFFFVPFLLSL